MYVKDKLIDRGISKGMECLTLNVGGQNMGKHLNLITRCQPDMTGLVQQNGQPALQPYA